MNDSVDREWITTEEAMHITSLSRTTIWRICSLRNSGIKVARIGRAKRIKKDTLLAYMDRSTTVEGDTC